MTMRVKMKDQYIDKFQNFIKTLPKDAIEINSITDNSISIEQAQEKVQNAINNINSNKSLNLEDSFLKISNS
jgi:hypothetical protein